MKIFDGIPELPHLFMSKQLVDDITTLLRNYPSNPLEEGNKSYRDWVKPDSAPDLQESDIIDDYRFKGLFIRDFRCYGRVDSHPDVYFGMELLDNKGKICSKCMVLGQNGVGKSTLFNAAECFFTGSISEAQYRHVSNVKSFAGSEIVDMVLLTNGQQVLKAPPKNPWLFSRFFISEYSILEASSYIADKENWYPFFCEMLGVGDVYRLINDTLPNVKKTIESLHELMSKQRLRYELLQFVLYVKDYWPGMQEQLNLLLSSLSHFMDNPQKEHIHELINQTTPIKLPTVQALRTEMKTALKQLGRIEKNPRRQPARDAKGGFGLEDSAESQKAQVMEELKTKVSELLNLLQHFMNSIFESSSLKYLEHKLMTDYVQNGGYKTTQPEDSPEEFNSKVAKTLTAIESYCQQAKMSLNTFVSSIVDEQFKNALEDLYADSFLMKGETFTFDISQIDNDSIFITMSPDLPHAQQIPVNRYFNMFRFRLFFLSVQSMLCIRMMQVTGIIFPLLFDDVFYANDYINKQQLVKFFKMLDDYADKNSRVKERMQLIFFSHDEQLVSAIHSDAMGKKEGAIYSRMVDSSLVSAYPTSIRSLSTEDGSLDYFPVMLPIFTR